MRYLRALCLIAVVLFCGSVASHAQNFRVQVLDPTCDNTMTECILHPADLGVPFSVSLLAGTCGDAGVNPLPDGPFGCFFAANLTGEPITSFTLDFNAIPLITGCDTNITGVNPPVAFSVSSCVVNAEGGYDLSFTGGSIATGHNLIILEEGVDPALFTGLATANPVPEPDSILLLSTGAMMMAAGLFIKQRRFAFGKK
jgi:hypothetical protein